MLTEKQIKKLARTSCIRGIRYYKQRIHEEVDILSGEEKRLIMEEMERIIAELKEKEKEREMLE